MIAVRIARIIANIVIFFEQVDEDVLNLDTACEQLEILGAGLQVLDKAFLRELVDAFDIIAPEYGTVSRGLVRRIAHGFYLEEAIAGDDPVRLAELEGRRAAEDERPS